MAYEVLREERASLAAAWAALLERTPEPVPFVHPAWQRVWLDEFRDSQELLLYAVRDGDELIGVAPLLQSDGRLMLSGDFSICDYMDIVAAPGRAEDVLAALLPALAGGA